MKSFALVWTALLVLTAFLTVGCGEGLSLAPVEPADNSGTGEELGNFIDSNLFRLRQDALIVVDAQIIHEEIEGSSAFDVQSLRSDDPAIVEVTHVSGNRFVIHAKAPGETVVRGYIDDDERGAIPVRVLSNEQVEAIKTCRRLKC